MNFSRCFVAAVLVCVSQPVLLWGATRATARHVREGIRKHQAGDYQAAEESFAQAAETSPQDPRIAFNRACALAAQDKGDEAAKLFREASLARDAQLVAASRYNLGCLESSRAKARFGERPEEAIGEVREEGLALLTEAVAHYRDCLRVSPDHKRARHNLELLRLWIKNMQDVWAERDRQRRREEMDLLQFLEMLTAQQRLLRATDRILAQEDSPLGPGGARHSPRGRQAIAETERQQRELAEEIDPLRQKIEQALEPPPAAAAGNPPTAAPAPAPDEHLEQARKVLDELALRGKGNMFQAADDLAVRELEQATEAQSEALQALDDIFRAVAPFEGLLQKATATQQQLVDSSTQFEQADPATGAASVVESAELVEDQSRVAGWTETLTAKAQHGLLQPGSQPPAVATVPPDDENQPAAASPAANPMEAAYEKAVELGPRISGLASEATELLEQAEWSQALPKQQEALRLLKEIAEQQPENQDQEEQQQDQQDQQQDQQDQQQQQDQDQQQSSNEKKQEQQQQQQRLSREQAEALLRKARQREREHRERQKELQQYLRAGVAVDKDW